MDEKETETALVALEKAMMPAGKARMNVKRVRGLLIISLMAVALTAMTLTSYGQVTSNVLRRTLLIQASQEGTAFTIEVDGRQYLITAKHIVATFSDGAASTIQIRKKSGWSPITAVVFKCDEPVDIAVLVPPAQLTVSYPLEPTSKGMIIGQDAYFVGFPYGTSITYASLPDVFGFVKKATVALFDPMPEHRAQVIELDGYNNPGFFRISGSLS